MYHDHYPSEGLSFRLLTDLGVIFHASILSTLVHGQLVHGNLRKRDCGQEMMVVVIYMGQIKVS